MMDKILEMLEDIRPDSDFNSSEDFIADVLLDSADIMELVAQLEDAFSIEIHNLDIVPENFVSVESLMNLVNKCNGAI